MQAVSVLDLVGKTLTGVRVGEGMDRGSDAIYFHSMDGANYTLTHEQD